MKHRNIFILILPFLTSLQVMTSCDDPDALDPGQERVNVSPCDERAYLYSNFIRTDNNGAFVSRVYGRILDEADTTVVFVSADSFEDADSLLREHLLPESAAQRVKTNNEGLSCTLKDASGKTQGTITLTRSNDEFINDMPAVAHLVLGEGVAMPDLSEVWFIPSSLWPENDVNPHKKGEVLYSKAYDISGGEVRFTDHPFVCIADAEAGHPAYFVYCSSAPFTAVQLDIPGVRETLATVAEARNVMELCLDEGTAEDFFSNEHFLVQASNSGYHTVWCHKYVATSIPIYYVGYTEYVQTFDWYVDEENLNANDVSHRTISVICL